MEEKRFLSPWGLAFCGLLILAAGALYLILYLMETIKPSIFT